MCLSLIDLSDDFADVDLREELCYHSRPKKEKFGGGLLRFIDFLESVFYGGGAVIDFSVSAKNIDNFAIVWLYFCR